jgi:hypothetical protein
MPPSAADQTPPALLARLEPRGDPSVFQTPPALLAQLAPRGDQPIIETPPALLARLEPIGNDRVLSFLARIDNAPDLLPQFR